MLNWTTVKVPTLPSTVPWQDIFDEAEVNHFLSVRRRVELFNFPLNQTNLDGETVAHIAAKHDNLVMCKYLVRRDPRLLEMKDEWDQTVLAVALSKGSMYIVRHLVDDLKVSLYHPSQQRFGDMAIHIAANEGRMEVLKYLVEEKGVDVDIVNFVKEPPLFLAAEKPRMHAVRYLVEKAEANVAALDWENCNILYVSAKTGDLKVPKYLLDQRNITLDINWQDIIGRTVVYMASRFNHTEFVKYCVEEKGADIHLTNDRGWTPLFEAAFNDNIEVVKYLIDRGADINHRDKENKTLEQVAEETVVKFLNKTRHERIRRSVPEPTVDVTLFSNHESQLDVMPRQNVIWEKVTDLSFRNLSVLSIFDVSVSKVQSLLAILNAVCGSYPKNTLPENQQKTLHTPTDMIHARMDHHVAVEAVRRLPNF